MRASELVLHVGFQQTGATMLQRALVRVRPELRRHGIGFVDHAALARLESLDGWQCQETTDPSVVPTFEQDVAALVAEEEAAVAKRCRLGVRATVISSDHLLGCENVTQWDGHPFRRFAELAIGQVIRAVDAPRVRLVLYVRRQDRLMEACYLRELQKGRTHEFAEQFPHRFEPVLDYHELVGRLEDIPGVEGVRVRPFELVGSNASSYVNDFLSVLGLTGEVDITPVGTDLVPYRVYSRQAMSIALDVNKYLDSERERRLVREFLKRRFPGTDDHSTRFLPQDERAGILDAYSSINRKLFERSMPDLPVDAYASDEATARLAAVSTCGQDDTASGERRRPAGTLTDQEAVRGVGPHFDEVTFPVDLVYTWVDGEDPQWLAWKDAALRQLDPDHHTVDGEHPSRYRNHDELRYSLRSVMDFAGFVRHVFIVTDGQVPPWLNVDHDRLTVVDHRDIFPDHDCLPTFNSHAIECRLHHITGLAEHYLYLNDDFFFARPVTADQFFHGNGMTKFFLSQALIGEGDPSSTERSVDAAAMNTRRLVYERFGRVVSQKIKHAPYPQRRSIVYEMEEALRDEFASTAASRLRSPDDVAVPSSLFHYYAYLTGRAVPAKISSRYVSFGDRGLGRRLRALRRHQRFDVVCLNDSVQASDPDKRERLLRRFMTSYWPTKSPFER